MTCICSSCVNYDDTAEREPLLDPSRGVHDRAERGIASSEPELSLEVESKPAPKRRALLIGICYGECGPQEELSELKGPHKDARAMQSLLVGAYKESITECLSHA